MVNLAVGLRKRSKICGTFKRTRAMSKKRPKNQGDLFIEPFGSLQLIGDSAEWRAIEAQRVECLGMTFENDEARRNYFLDKLREKLKDPEFRKIEGFPKGEDEDILRLS